MTAPVPPIHCSWCGDFLRIRSDGARVCPGCGGVHGPKLSWPARPCNACEVEAKTGTQEDPHPVPAQFHTCLQLSVPPPTPPSPRRDSGTPGGLAGAKRQRGPSSPPPGGGAEGTTRGLPSRHECHAAGCKVATPPARFMCRMHWFALPPTLRRRILESYQAGQESNKRRPSGAWMVAAFEAIAFVAAAEQREDAEFYEKRADFWRKNGV